MAEPARHSGSGGSVAVIGLACRFPDADDPPTLLDTILTGRRAFRRLPPARLDLAAYESADAGDPGTADDSAGRLPASDDAPGRGARAGLIEGWRFDREAFRISPSACAATDPAHWLALETAARALAAAGFPGGTGLDRDRIGVIIGHAVAGEDTRASALRLRWPYVRRVLAESLFAGGVRTDRARNVLRHAAARYLAPAPRPGEYPQDGSQAGMAATIPARISSYFGFRGGGHAIDGACASSLQAVASACAALSARDIDVALAGGVDVSLDPLELLAQGADALAGGEMRIYDENPTGYLPGEGCGVVVLMRTAQARAAGLPVYAEILGWGTSAGGMPGVVASDASSQLLALRRAYERAGADPREVQLIEGHGSGNPAEDEAELTALAELRCGARDAAALGSIKANIGHAKAAAGAAGLIKTVLALGTGVIPPTTGVLRPHPLLRAGDAALWLPEVAEEWPSGARMAGVSAMGVGGVNVHLVLRNAPGRATRHDRVLRVLPRLARAGSGRERAARTVRASDRARRPMAYLLHGADRRELAASLTRIAQVAAWLSDAELADLACQLGRDTRVQGPARAGIVASRQEELARLAAEALALLPDLSGGLVATRPGIFAADGADGRVTLLLSDEADPATPAGQRHATAGGSPAPRQAAITDSLAALRWLESLDVNITAVVGHGLGEIAGLAWAGVLSEVDVAEIAALRAEYLSGPAVRVLKPAGRHAGRPRADEPDVSDPLALLRESVGQFRFGPPRRRLVSTRTGRELASAGEVVDLICGGFAGGDRLTDAVTAGAVGATLLVETGPGRLLASTAARVCRVPTVGMDPAGTGAYGAGAGDGEGAASADRAALDEAGRAWAGAALFAAGAIGQVQPLFAGRQSRPIDIRRERVFITGACSPSTGAEADPPRGREPAASSPAAGPAPRPADLGEPDQRARPPIPAIPSAHPADPDEQDDQARPAIPAIPSAHPADPADPDEQDDQARPAIPAIPSARPAQPAAAAGPLSPLVSAAPPAVTAPGRPAPATQPRIVLPARGGRPGASRDNAKAAAEAGRGQPGSGRPSTELLRRVIAGLAASDAPAAPPAAGARPPEAPPRGAAPDRSPAGVGPWARCFTEALRAAAAPPGPADDGPWRMHAGGNHPFKDEIGSVFAAAPDADRSLLVLGDAVTRGSMQVALRAAGEALVTGRLTAITTGPGLTGFLACLHAERPELGITVLRVPGTAGGLRSARRFARAEPGQFRELVIAADGSASEPVPAARDLPGGAEFPLGPSDVVLLSRACGGAGLALVQVLACCGAAVAVIGRAAHDDRAVVAGLEELRLAGARVAYEVVDTTSPADMTLAVRRIEARLGPVTAVAHAARPGAAVPVAELTQQDLGARLGAGRAALHDLLRPVRTERLRLILTFGSVAARSGLPGQAALAAASTALAGQAEDVAAQVPGCRSLHVQLPGWAGEGLGDDPGLARSMADAGTAAITIADAARLLLRVLAAPDLPDRVAVHGRIGVPGPARAGSAPGLAGPRAQPGDDAGLVARGRFLEQVRVHYPGIELVCDTTLSLATDPYLADYRVDGLPVLPPVMAVEALAQAASALAGRPLRRAEGVTMDAPVVVPAAGGGATRIRICALADGGTITAVLRCEDSGFAVDHTSAQFRAEAKDAADGTGSARPAELATGATGIVDGAELYGPVCFQSGRFRRIAILPEVISRSARALARGAEDRPWFAPSRQSAGGPAGRPGTDATTGLLLGSPGLNDAACQVLQACVPDRRVWVASCESMSFSGRAADGPVEIRAVASPAPPARAPATPAAYVASAAPPAPSAPTLVSMPAPARSPDQAAPPAERAAPSAPELAWDVQVLDAAGNALATWRGARLREDGLLPRNAAWPPSLLSLYLERSALDLGLDAALRIRVRGGQPAGARHPDRPADTGAAAPVPRQRSGTVPPLAPSVVAVPQQAGEPATGAVAAGTGQLAGFTLEAAGPSSAACGWATADQPPPARPAGGPRPGDARPEPRGAPHRQAGDVAAALARLHGPLAEQPSAAQARLRAVAACLAMARVPPLAPVTLERATGDGWSLLDVGGTRVACTVVEISGLTSPVAIAVATDAPHAAARRQPVPDPGVATRTTA